MIASFIAAFVVFWNYNNFANYLVQRLYKIEKKDAKSKAYKNYDDRSEFIHPCCMSNCRDFICDLFPSCLQCCRSGKQDKGISLGRDKLGAGAVNLVPASQPQDVYSEIAAIVDRKRAEDAEAGKEIAMVCEGHVKRKVVKQTVMTTVYGVTKYGAQLQIKKQLKDIDDFETRMV